MFWRWIVRSNPCSFSFCDKLVDQGEQRITNVLTAPKYHPAISSFKWSILLLVQPHTSSDLYLDIIQTNSREKQEEEGGRWYMRTSILINRQEIQCYRLAAASQGGVDVMSWGSRWETLQTLKGLFCMRRGACGLSMEVLKRYKNETSSGRL